MPQIPDQNSLGPMGPNIISVESIDAATYSVQGSNFTSGFTALVQDGVGQVMEGISLHGASGTAFTFTLPYATPGPCTLVVANPDGSTSTKVFRTPSTTLSNEAMRSA